MPKCHCGKRGSFNIKGERPLFCSLHKTDDMINVSSNCCEYTNCKTTATYNFPGNKKRRFCKLHKENGMINVKDRICCVDGCTTIATCNLISEKIGKYCGQHKSPEMVCVMLRKCMVDNCTNLSKFNHPTSKKGRYCYEHKTSDMVLIKTYKTCELCDTLAQYNRIGSKKGRYCFKHKLPDMIDVLVKRCEVNGCTSISRYKHITDKAARFCFKHKEKEMINISAQHCEISGCTIQPSFNVVGKGNPLRCAKHKEADMIDVRHRCITENCKKTGFYNYPHLKTRKYCKSHALPDMVPIKHTCAFTGCYKFPLFNIANETHGKFCLQHKTCDMINISAKKCKVIECQIQSPMFGFIGQQPIVCGQHREKGMIFRPRMKCSVSCNMIGVYEKDGLRYCDNHLIDKSDAINFGISPCMVCGLNDILINNKCETCQPDVISHHIHVKEMNIHNLLTLNNISFVHDRILENTSCGKERPDFQIDCGSHYIYIEVDEHQHSSYACECEQMRMINLANIRGLPVTFIRYNPDSYKPKGNQKQFTRVKKESKLLEWVNYCTNHSPTERNDIANVIYLFYDEYDHKTPEWKSLIPMMITNLNIS